MNVVSRPGQPAAEPSVIADSRQPVRFGFWFDYDQTYTFCALFNELKRRIPSAAASGFVLNDRYWSHAKENLPSGSVIFNLYELVEEGLRYQPSPKELADFKIYDEELKLAHIAYSDRHLYKYTQPQLINLYVYLLGKFRAYVDEAKPDLFLFNCVASHFSHLCYLVLRERGVRVVIPFTYGFDDLIYLSDNPYLISLDIWQTYADYKSGKEQPQKPAVEWAEQLIARIRKQGSAYAITSYITSEHHRFRFPNPISGLKYLYNHFRYYRSDPNLPTARERLMEIVTLRWNRWKAKRLFVNHDVLAGENFIYFPLHFEPEISTLIFSQYDHRTVIDIVARQLPLTWKLAVKDHPVMIGRRDYRYFKELRDRYPNIVILDPAENSQRLVREARAVLTLSGTTALEAMVLGTPVIMTSPVRFGGFGHGTFSHDLINFRDVLATALKKRNDEADIVRMLAAIWSHCRKFEIAEPLGCPSVLAPENIAAIADVLLEWSARHA
jgi:hypothetical protein